MLITDYHIHTPWSDGRSSVNDFVKSAIDKGLDEIGFSDHLTLLPDISWSMTVDQIKRYCDEVLDAKANNSEITVRLGLEVDYLKGKEQLIESTLKNLPLDYVIGSIHFIDDWSIDYKADLYKNRNIDKVYKDYYALILDLCKSGLFDIVGHMDLIKIFGFKPSINLENTYTDIAKAIAENGMSFEVNTNGRNKPVGEFYPSSEILSIMKNFDIPVMINSDSHDAHRVGEGFTEASQLLSKAGLTKRARYENRELFISEAKSVYV